MGIIDDIVLNDNESRKLLFDTRLSQYSGLVNGSQGFGSQKEKTVHSFLKTFYSGNSQFEEVSACGYICDVLCDNDIIEIQSKYFYRLKDKLEALLNAGYRVMIVFPVARRKQIEWIDPETGETVAKKLSPKKGDIYAFLNEAYGIRELLDHPGLSFCITLIDITERKLLDGYGKDKKVRATKYDRIPDGYYREVIINEISDYDLFVPLELDEFDRKEYAKSVKLNYQEASTALTLLSQLGIIERTGTRNRKYTYKLVKKDRK